MLNDLFKGDGVHGAKRKRADVTCQDVYAVDYVAPCNIPYMGRTRKDFAIERGKKIKTLRKTTGSSQEELRKHLGLKSRVVMAQYETGATSNIPLDVLRKLMKMGMNATDLLEDPTSLEEINTPIDASTEARHIAHEWDELPHALREYIRKHVDIWLELKDKSPTLAMLLKTPTDSEREKALYSVIENFDAKFRAANPLKKSRKAERSKE